MPLAIVPLFLAAFCVGTTEFVIAGLLPEISGDLGVTLSAAGYLITAYAFAVAIGGPAITLATARLPRRQALLLLMSVFIAGHVVCAVAPDYRMLMAGRLIVALSHGSFYGVAAVVAVKIVPGDRRGSAVACLFAGISLATILGVPGGTAIGNWFGWRATFWVVGAAAVAVSLAMMLTIPRDSDADGARPTLAAQVAALGNQKVLLSYAVFALMQIGFWSFFTFIAPWLTEVASVTRQHLPLMLLLFGIGGTLGSIAGGRLADLDPVLTLSAGFPVQAAIFAALAMTGGNPVVTGIAMPVLGMAIFLPKSALVNRILAGASAAPDLASTLVSTAANIGIAIGPVVGAGILATGGGYVHLPWAGVLFCLLAGGLMNVSLSRDRQVPAPGRAGTRTGAGALPDAAPGTMTPAV